MTCVAPISDLPASDYACLHLRRPPPSLKGALLGMAYRRDMLGGTVTAELPELRPSIQIMLGDDYWLCEREQGAQWRRAPRIALWGARTQQGYGYVAARVEMVIIALTHAGVRALTDQAAGCFTNQVVPLEHVAPSLFRGLARAFAGGTGPETWVEQLLPECRASRALMRATPTRLDDAIMSLVDGATIPDAAAISGVSERQFRRLVERETGMPPKTYQRLARFNQRLREVHPASWMFDGEPKAAPDYYDQSHSIREFTEYAGVTPRQYVRIKLKEGSRIMRSIPMPGVTPPELGVAG